MTVQFGSLFKFIRNGMNVRQDKSGDGLPITRIETISEAAVDPARVGYAGLKEDQVRNWLLEPGDILFSHINSVQHIGKCAVYRGEPTKLVHGMNLLCLRSDTAKLLPEFAKYLLRSWQFRSQLAHSIKKAVNQASISIGDLRSIPVTLPSLTEQRRIAEIVDKADVLRGKRRAALALLDTLTCSIFLDMFGDPTTNPKGWPIAQLGEKLSTTSGGTPDRDVETYFGGSIPWVKSGELHQGVVTMTEEMLTERGLAESSAKIMKPGTVLLAMYGATVGKVAALGIEAATNQAICCIQPTQVIQADYLIHLIRRLAPSLLAKRVGGAQPNLSQDLIRKLIVPLPTPELQSDFARRILGIGKVRRQVYASLSGLNALYLSLQHHAFRGDL
jgi:type I restriction enzyme, S subunit